MGIMIGFSKASFLQKAGKFHNYIASPNFCIVVLALSALAHILSLELPAYLLFTVMAVYICLFDTDLLGLIPICVACYIMPTAANNPGKNPNAVFYGWSIGVMGLCIALSLVYRVIRDRRRFFSGKCKCIWGMIALCGAYLLGGIGSEAYLQTAKNNLLFALMQCACLLLPYWLFSRGIDWGNVRRDYFAWMGFSAGGVLSLQVLWCYCTQGVIVDGIIRRTRIYTGWGMYNNIGFLLAFFIPFAFYLATKYRKGWMGTVVGSISLICVFLTCSRSSIIGAVFIYALCVLIMLLYARNKRHNFIALITVSVISLTVILLFRKQLGLLFSELLAKGLLPSNRDKVYPAGMKLFLQNPVLGVSFFSPGYKPWDFSALDSFSNLIPPRWHNTIVQLLASCGVVGLAAYILHRVQTVKMLLSRHHKDQVFIGCAVIVMILCSLLDCHFFNLGPTIIYSAALAWAEFAPEPRT